MWGATWLRPLGQSCQKDFNPRAPCGARQHLRPFSRRSYNFNPRAPCGARLMDQAAAAGNNEFQSTRPVWGATTRKLSNVQRAKISIHAPRVGRDRMYVHLPMRHNQFQSTRPVWGATNEETERFSPESISIHAPRVGRDYAVAQNLFGDCISIHAPRVGRDRKFDDFNPSNLHKRYKRILARPKDT